MPPSEFEDKIQLLLIVYRAGVGPGRYAIELCKVGYQIVLFDISAGDISLEYEGLSKKVLILKVNSNMFAKFFSLKDPIDTQKLYDII